MSAIRLIAILLLTGLGSAQEFSSPELGRSNTPKPKLPVVDYNACPGKGVTVPNVKVEKSGQIYPSWLGNGTPIGKLKAGEELTVLAGVNVVREPDKAVIKFVGRFDDPSLKVGDVALGYGAEADGNIVFWSNGVWFAQWIEAVAEKGACGFTSGFGQGGCVVDITEDGTADWWVQVKTKSGLTGWVLASKYDGGKRWFGNFSNLCQYGED